MKILLDSHAYAPRIGGIETVSQILAQGLRSKGHQVVVTTRTPGASSDGDLQVVRQPDWKTLQRLLSSSDVLVQSNISLPVLLAALWRRIPVLLIHHTWIARSHGGKALKDRFKLFMTRFADRNLAVSDALARTIPVTCGLFPNPYRADVFQTRHDMPRDLEFVYVGRLVSDKGVDLLLEALARLDANGKPPWLSILGEGPERRALEQQAGQLGIASRVRFLGSLSPQEVASELNRHRVLVAPSRWNEPFGLIALEGMACGCRVVGSSGGGLPEAMGGLGHIFPNGQVMELERAMKAALGAPPPGKEVEAHLHRHHPEQVVRFLLDQLQSLLSQ